ncbi:MAG: tyrosinase family protein [Actinobacteria bacterium]|nr:MAG: tyrosinase family protein [Actinomycetota bacterium]
MAGSMIYRLPVADATAPHMIAFRSAMAKAEAISDNRGYNFIAGFHGAPFWYCWHHQINRRTRIRAQLFLPWHRAYLWYLEQALRDQEEAGAQVPAALPYWDWTTQSRIPPAYAATKVGTEANPLYATKAVVPNAQPPINRRTTRSPGRTPGSRLPTAAEIADVLTDTDWMSFADRLEGFHDDVHVWVGGSMQDVTTAAYDPIFFAHHCMIDRIWYLWQVKHGSGGIPGELLDLELPPFGKRTRDVLDVQGLGYEYAASAANVPVPTGGAQ